MPSPQISKKKLKAIVFTDIADFTKLSVQWNATDMHGKPVSAGVYLYQIRVGEFVQTKKMVLLK